MWPPVPFLSRSEPGGCPSFTLQRWLPAPHHHYPTEHMVTAANLEKILLLLLFCRLCNSDLHIQEHTHVISFKTSPLGSVSSSLLFVKYNYCRKFPDFQALPHIRPALASLPTLCLTSPSSPPQLLLLFPLQVYVQFCPDPAHLAPLARGRTVPCFIQTRFSRASTRPAAGLKIKYVGQCCNTGKKTINSEKNPKKRNFFVSVFCIFRGCRITNVNFRKVSRDNIRPDFQLGRKEPCSKSLSCIESVLK